jgi:hypothetical protein
LAGGHPFEHPLGGRRGRLPVRPVPITQRVTQP